MGIGELIQEAREKRGWSRTDLASKAEVSPASITRIETGERIGHVETIARIARALELPADHVFKVLLGEEGAAPTAPVNVLDQVAELVRRIEKLEGRDPRSDETAGVWRRLAVGVAH